MSDAREAEEPRRSNDRDDSSHGRRSEQSDAVSDAREAGEPSAKAEESLAGAGESSAKAEEPGTGADEPSAKAEEPGTGADEPSAMAEEPRTGAEAPSTKAEEPLAGADEPLTDGAGPESRRERQDDGGRRKYGPLGTTLVIIPTYNEAENIKSIVERVRKSVPDAHILVADDNSPDGTGKVADELAAEDDRVKVLHRKGKEGLGAAYLAGFRWGIEHGYGVLVEMDADGSHQPEELPRLLTALKGADLVIGSRWVPGGRIVNWPKSREFISRGGSTYSRLLLDVPIRDMTAGYRAFRKETLEGIGMDEVASQGYCFQIDLAWRAIKAGFHVIEVPVTFIERERGESKMSRDIVTEAAWRVMSWGVGSRVNKMLGRKEP
ncbi:glycosyl transferase family 2 [Streptomyces violaceusniger Tu 4113]|uniref:Glycosyl transferase family 2 n=2 Tax=Streptomyces violaceusniger TaxID=68280 RepID=G2PE22_STRV4|nr:glycosyl transferase family 2 [Streptomyces violaceusniger Tu 4113]